MIKIKNQVLNISLGISLYLFTRWILNKHKTKTNLRKAVVILNKLGYKIYGTHTCPYCVKQLSLISGLKENIPFIDCTLMKEECIKAGISGYPTWVDSTGAKFPGYKDSQDIINLAKHALSS